MCVFFFRSSSNKYFNRNKFNIIFPYFNNFNYTRSLSSSKAVFVKWPHENAFVFILNKLNQLKKYYYFLLRLFGEDSLALWVKRHLMQLKFWTIGNVVLNVLYKYSTLERFYLEAHILIKNNIIIDLKSNFPLNKYILKFLFQILNI